MSFHAMGFFIKKPFREEFESVVYFQNQAWVSSWAVRPLVEGHFEIRVAH